MIKYQGQNYKHNGKYVKEHGADTALEWGYCVTLVIQIKLYGMPKQIYIFNFLSPTSHFIYYNFILLNFILILIGRFYYC